MKNNRTIKNVIAGKKKVYFYLSNKSAKEKFIQMAKAEGCTFDKQPIRDLRAESIMSVDKNLNLYFVGQIGNIIMKSKQNNEDVPKIDFEKYITGNDDYNFNR